MTTDIIGEVDLTGESIKGATGEILSALGSEVGGAIRIAANDMEVGEFETLRARLSEAGVQVWYDHDDGYPLARRVRAARAEEV